MKDVNYPLRKIYFAALNGLIYNGVPIKAFYQKAPDNIDDPIYIIFSGITNSDVSSKSNPNTETSVQVTIHSHELKYNDGRAADDIAGLILEALYPASHLQSDMSADGLQLVNTMLSGDTTQSYNIQGSREYLDRILTFKHRVYQQ